MEIVELEAVDSRVTRLRCLFCKHWGRFEDLKPLNQDSLEQAPCPHCGDTGEELWATELEAKRAYEEWKANRES